ncbi:site-2 protease family protein [Peribacillus deserti]|uniref:Site-2 protease family protein n=1 Tax=Peribacillus deserti TaxID=673318 RepID=A0A2N5MBX7_9BACI|nr:site-2 protease family protein [Peribacillus deserti]PLT31843.1 site-2 protease family protein [Peribacillus deserti]
MQSFLRFPLEEIPYVVVTLMIAFTLHEFAHAYVAYKFGDPTAQKQGRLTLNPAVHLDPLGTLLLLIAGFGWARPVPVNRHYFKNPRLAGILVSIAGPLSNLLIAAIGFMLYFGFMSAGILGNEYVINFLHTLIEINVVLFVFNLLPVPPLDGYRVLEDLAPDNVRAKMSQFEMYGSLIFLVIVITPLGDYIITPIFQTVIPLIYSVLANFFSGIFL